MSERDTGPHFVWIIGQDGQLHGQKWAELYYGVDNWQEPLVKATHPLTEQELALTINELSRRYPAPQLQEA